MTFHCYRNYLFVLLLLCTAPAISYAQQADTVGTGDYASERDLIETTLGTFVRVIKTAAFREEDPSVTDRLQMLATRLNAVNQSLPMPLTAQAASNDSTLGVSMTELQNLETSLNELYDLVRDVRMTMESEDNFEVADRLTVVEEGIDDAVVQTRRLIRSGEKYPSQDRRSHVMNLEKRSLADVDPTTNG